MKHILLTSLVITTSLLPTMAEAVPAVPAPGPNLPAQEAEKPDNLENVTPLGEKHTGEERFTINGIKVEHEGMRLSDRKIQTLADEIIGREVTVTELHQELEAITLYARQKYPTAAAYIPPQTAVDGKLVVRIAPGRLGKLILENESGLKDRVARGYLAALHQGDIIEGRTLETALNNLRDLSGVEAYCILSPGADEGTTDITVKVTKEKTNRLIAYSENYGSKTAGRYRYGLQGELGNLGGTGGRLDIGGLISSEEQHGYNISAEMPVGHSVDLLCKVNAQAAGSNLDSSEHIYLGGPHGIRAYPQGEASSDEGILGTLELRYHTPLKGLTLSTYLDAGHVRIAHDAGDTMTLKGWGAAITYSKPDDWFARFDYARRIGSDDFMSKEAESRQQMWFMVGKIF